MNIRLVVTVLLSVIFTISAQDNLADQNSKKILFVYDTLDNESRFFIETFQNEFKKQSIAFDEMAVSKSDVNSLEKYKSVLIYSRVMAFNMKSPVRSWLKQKKEVSSVRFNIFVTANRWFNDNNLEQLLKLVTGKKGVAVDAVSMATNKMSNEQKVKRVREYLGKIKSQL